MPHISHPSSIARASIHRTCQDIFVHLAVVNRPESSLSLTHERKTHVDPVTPRQRKLKTPQIEAMFRAFHAVEPEPKGELNYVSNNAHALLVAVALSAQATDVSVNKATAPLFKSSLTLTNVDLGGLRPASSKPLAFTIVRPRILSPLPKFWLTVAGGEVPREREALEALPGLDARPPVMIYLQMCWEDPDRRRRMFSVAVRRARPGKTPLAVELALEKRIPATFLTKLPMVGHHGRYLCKARKPEC